jgi:hypothetical protein
MESSFESCINKLCWCSFWMVTCQLLISSLGIRMQRPAKQQRNTEGWLTKPLPMAKPARAFMRVSKCY